MEFKYHKAYKGYYLVENGKFKRPYKKLDKNLTEEKLLFDNIKIEFNENSIVNVLDNYVVFFNKEQKETSEKKENKIKETNFELKTGLVNIVPDVLIKRLVEFIDYQEGQRDINTINSVLEIIENIVYVDALFKTKINKMFYYNDSFVLNLFERYLPTNKIDDSFKKEIIENYPSQYVYEHLPLDYKEKEMIYVFYFIMFIELFSTLK